MRASALLCLALSAGCYYELEPLALVLDQGVPDLALDAAFDLAGDAPRCANGAAPLHGPELSDPPLDRWSAEALQPITVTTPTTTVVLDTARTIAGAGALRLDTLNGAAGLLYPGTRDAHLDLSPYLYVSFSATADDASAANDPGWKGAQPHLLVVTSPDDYYEYVPADVRLPRSPGAFQGITVPLAGGFGWSRNRFGEPDLARVRYLALTFETWGAGFTVWIDDLRVGPGDLVDCP